ncbi:MAG: hypothetical protein MJ195_02805 [Mycoplasmoidaceae bacterium]|nr:hypothetical protein [Mycoplasmoidaceae bacterium]
MTIDFSQIITLTGGINYYRNIEHQRDITNKLALLNRYAQRNTANHNNMTDLLATPITSDTGAQYFYLGGFGEIEIDPYGEGAILSPY